MYQNDLLSGRPTPKHRQSQIQCFKLAFSVRALFQFARTLSGRKGLWHREEKWVVVMLLLGSTFLAFSDNLSSGISMWAGGSLCSNKDIFTGDLSLLHEENKIQ